MPIPPAKKTTQSAFVKTSLRLPPGLHAELLADAEHNGHSLNQEIINRLRNTSADKLPAELAEIKGMLRKVLDEIT